MNILMMSGDTTMVQGRQGAFYNTLDEFARYWEKVDIIVPPITGISRYDCFRNVSLYPSPWPKMMQKLFISVKGQELASEREYDMIVSHDYGLSLNGRGASQLVRRLGVPHVSEIHHVDGYPRAANVRERIQPWLTRGYIRMVQPTVAGFRITNESELRPLLTRWGVPQERILMLYSLYLNFEIFQPKPVEQDFDAIFCGRLAPNKGPFLFLEGVALARKQRRDLRVLIIGQGPLAARLSKRAADLGLAEAVEFREWISTPNKLADLYRRSRCLVCTSLSEGGPRVVAEALACGVPVITTRVGMAADLVQNGVNGFQIDWSSQEMADRLIQISSDRELQYRLHRAAPEAVQRFEKSRVIREYALAYQNLARRCG